MQDAGKLGQRAACVSTRCWTGALLDRRVALVLMLVYLIASSVDELATVASRVIRWASAWHRPAFCVVATARLAWTGRGQAQRLWASARALVRRQVLRPRPATCLQKLRADLAVCDAEWNTRVGAYHWRG